MSDEKIDVLAVMDDLIDFEERHAEAEPRANYEAREAREAVDELVKAAQRVLEKDWEYGDDQPHFARLNAALARVRSSEQGVDPEYEAYHMGREAASAWMNC